MLYQLPSGKVIYLSIEEYLNMSDLELHQLVHSGLGEDAPHPAKVYKYKEDKPDDDEPIDMTSTDDMDPDLGPIDWENIPDM